MTTQTNRQEDLDFVRGPGLASYLRFEMLLWGAIAVLSLLSLLGRLLLPMPTESNEPDYIPGLAGVLLFSLGALVIFAAVWRFRKWGVYALALWTGLLIVALVSSLLSPARDLLLALALAGFIVARVMVLFFGIRPRWPYFRGGLF